MPFYSSLKIGNTPQILIDVGCSQLPMLYTQKHLKDAIKPINEKEHQHGLSVNQIKNLPELLENPIMILDSPSKPDSIIVVTSEIDTKNNPVFVSIKPNGKGRYLVEEMDSNFVTSVYGRNNFIDFFRKVLEEDKLLYCDKIKSQVMFERWGEQYSELTNNLDYNKIIHQSRNIVNTKTEEKSEKSAEKEKFTSEIIGNTPFRYIPKKRYRNVPIEAGRRIAEEFDKNGIKDKRGRHNHTYL